MFAQQETVLEWRKESDADVVFVDPSPESARIVSVVHDISIGLHNIRIHPVGVMKDFFRLPVGKSDKANLALRSKTLKEREGVVQVLVLSAEVTVVEVVEIDIVGSERGERALHLILDLLRVVGVIKWPGIPTHLRGEKDSIPVDLTASRRLT